MKIDRQKWEHIKHLNIFSKYGSIPIEDRDLCVLIKEDGVHLPKQFIKNHFADLANFGIEEVHNYARETHKFTYNNINIVSNITPRPEQEPLIEEVVNIFNRQTYVNGIIQAAPGFGKTKTSLKLIELLGLKTLVIVPGDLLEEQWTKDIESSLNIEVGHIQGSDLDKLDDQFCKKVSVAKVQSLLSQLKSKDLNILKDVYSSFDLIIYDECHTSGSADGYSKTSHMFNTPNILGLSATPFTKDLNKFLMLNSIGEIIYISDHKNLIPDINLHNMFLELSPGDVNRLNWSKQDYIRFLATYNNILEQKPAYINYIADWVAYRHSQGYTTAILFSNNKLVEKLNIVLRARGFDPGVIIGKTKRDTFKEKLYISDEDYSWYYHNYKKTFPKRKDINIILKKVDKFDGVSRYFVNKKHVLDIEKINETLDNYSIKVTKLDVPNMSEREIAKTKKIIISNFKLLSAGFDLSVLSCLIFGSPLIGKIGVIQSIGRIARIDANKRQDIQVHFIFTDYFTKSFPNMVHTLKNNIKVEYDSKFIWEGFDFEKKE
jgi:superfamily II DNA or RNA helicase